MDLEVRPIAIATTDRYENQKIITVRILNYQIFHLNLIDQIATYYRHLVASEEIIAKIEIAILTITREESTAIVDSILVANSIAECQNDPDRQWTYADSIADSTLDLVVGWTLIAI